MKVSRPDANAANLIAARVTHRFPELAAQPIGDIWFTGSSVWSQIYGMPSPGHDWDIFALNEISALELITRMEWNRVPAFTTRQKRAGDYMPQICEANIPRVASVMLDEFAYSGGYCYMTDGGEVDVWISRSGSAVAEIRGYHTNSHSHCRAAFSLTDGLIVLPNEHAK